MLNLRLSEIALWTQGHLIGADALVTSVQIDSRAIAPGALFVALPGERHDAHDFVAAAHAAGAVAALVTRRVDAPLPQVLVADAQRALGDLAAAVRVQRGARVVGITGSNGKTSVKTLTAGILARHGRTHVNAGNFNNEIGLPLTLLAMAADAEFAVLEMGAGKPGDIAYLAAIARPEVGLVNNIAPAHLERMGSLEGVAETKGALYTALPEDGCAVINADDAFAGLFTALAGSRRVLRFGLDQPADVTATIHALGATSQFTLRTPRGSADVRLPLPGRHNVMNALAASALALALDVPLATVVAGLEGATGVGGRLARMQHAGWTLIDDSYNANPGSVAAAIDTLALEPGPTWLVLGDMKELGPGAEQLHGEAGARARHAGVARLWTVGPLARAAAAAFGPDAEHFADQEHLIAALRAQLRPGVTLLVKGSRSSAMDRVVAALTGKGDTAHAV